MTESLIEKMRTIPMEQLQKLLDFASRFCAIAVALMLPISTSLTEIFVYVTVVLSIFSGSFQKHWRIIYRSRIGLMLLLLYLFLAIGVAYSTAPLHQAIGGLFKYNKLFLGALLLPIFVDEKTRRYALLAFMAAMTFVMIASYGLVIKTIYIHGSYQTATVFKNHIAQNFLMAFSAYVFAISALKYKRWSWLFIFLAFLAVINTMFLSTGRSGYIIFAVLLFLFLWQCMGLKGMMLSVLAVLILFIAAFFISHTFHARTVEIIQNYHKYQHGQMVNSIAERITFAKNGLRLIKKHPVFGTGTGSFENEYLSLHTPSDVITVNPHNEYINMGVQLGTVGIALMLVMFYCGWRESDKLPKFDEKLAKGIIVAIGFGCLINSWLMDVTEGFTFVYFVALSFASFLAHSKTLTSRNYNNNLLRSTPPA